MGGSDGNRTAFPTRSTQISEPSFPSANPTDRLFWNRLAGLPIGRLQGKINPGSGHACRSVTLPGEPDDSRNEQGQDESGWKQHAGKFPPQSSAAAFVFSHGPRSRRPGLDRQSLADERTDRADFLHPERRVLLVDQGILKSRALGILHLPKRVKRQAGVDPHTLPRRAGLVGMLRPESAGQLREGVVHQHAHIVHRQLGDARNGLHTEIVLEPQPHRFLLLRSQPLDQALHRDMRSLDLLTLRCILARASFRLGAGVHFLTRPAALGQLVNPSPALKKQPFATELPCDLRRWLLLEKLPHQLDDLLGRFRGPAQLVQGVTLQGHGIALPGSLNLGRIDGDVRVGAHRKPFYRHRGARTSVHPGTFTAPSLAPNDLGIQPLAQMPPSCPTTASRALPRQSSSWRWLVSFFPFRLSAFPLFSFSCLLLLSSCAKRETPVEAGRRTQTLLVGNGAEPADLDPHTSTVLSDQNILMALFEGLTALDEQTAQPVPAAAMSWDPSADGLIWTFRLRPDLKWSDGTPLTSSDFVASWIRCLRPSVAAENAAYLHAVKNAAAFNAGEITDPSALGFAAPDAHTIVLTLEHPTPYLPALVSLPAWFPVNPRVLARFGAMEKRGTAWTREGHLVGNGAFILREWTPNVRVLVEKNPHHRDAATTTLRQIVFVPTDNPDTEERSFRAGQLHTTFNLPVAKIAAWREKNPAKLRVDPLLQSVFLRFNTTKPPFDNPKVRRALALALNRDSLARTALQGSRAPAHALVPPQTGAYTPRTHAVSDPVAARALLAEAGFPGGAGFPVVELQAKSDELMPRVAEALQAVWHRELGVKVEIVQLEQKTWIQNQQALTYAISTGSWTADFPDPVTFLGLFTGESSYNWTGWKNPAYDRLLTDAAATPNPQKRYEFFQQAEQLLLDEAAITPLYFGAQTYLLHPAVRGWVPSPLVFRRYQKVSLSPP